MSKARTLSWPAYALLVLAALPILFYGLGSYSAVNGDEVVYHMIARDMLETGDWLRLTSGNAMSPALEFRNAPFHYWIRAALITALGDNYWSMRLLSAVCGLAAVLATARLGAWLAGPMAGLIAGAAQLTTTGFVYIHSARTGELDSIVALLFVLIAHSFLRTVEEDRSFLAHHLWIALLMNVKLPLALVPLGAEFLMLTATVWGRARLVEWVRLGLCVWIPALSWHFARVVALAGGSMPGGVMGIVENLQLGVQGTAAEQRLARVMFPHWDYYSRVFAFTTLPYAGAYIVSAAAMALASVDVRRWRALALYSVVTVAFFLLLGRRNPWYLAPSYPLLACLFSGWVTSLSERRFGAAELAAACAAVVASAVVVNVDLFGFSPFQLTAKMLSAPLKFRAIDNLALWAAFAFGVTAVGVRLALRERPEILRTTAVLFAALLIGFATVRVALPLGEVDYISPAELARLRLDAAERAGESLPLPLPVDEYNFKKAAFYFEDRFAICFLGMAHHPATLIGPKGETAFCEEARTAGRERTEQFKNWRKRQKLGSDPANLLN